MLSIHGRNFGRDLDLNLLRVFAVVAETGDRLIMGLAHARLPVHGVQFHPESIASGHGHLILRNFLDLATAWNAATGRRAARKPQGRRRAAP